MLAAALMDLHGQDSFNAQGSYGDKDILIACIDNLKGFAEAISTVFVQTEVQSCIVHQIRNSLKYVGSKDQKIFMADLKPVYQPSIKVRPKKS